MSTRNPAVAGMFYAEQATQLQHDVQSLLKHIVQTPMIEGTIRAIVAPHAGYIYSGITQACAYKTLYNNQPDIEKILLLGPTHHVAMQILAAPSQQTFTTPLGEQQIAQEDIQTLLQNPHVEILDQAHVKEHSLEVQIPFIQTLYPQAKLIPLTVGHLAPEITANIIEPYWDDPKSMIIISSDLSHFHTYEQAHEIDSKTTELIVQLAYEQLTPERACGCFPLKGLLHLAQQRGAIVRKIHQCNSGDTAGDKKRVVGYGAYLVYE